MTKEELEKIKKSMLESIALAFSSLETKEESAQPIKRKRGRPAKPKPLEPIIENGEFPVIKVGDLPPERIEDVLNFEAPLADESRKKSNYITAAKMIGTSTEVKTVGNLQDFKKDPNRKIRFIDDPSVGDKISPEKYPERS